MSTLAVRRMRQSSYSGELPFEDRDEVRLRPLRAGVLLKKLDRAHAARRTCP